MKPKIVISLVALLTAVIFSSCIYIGPSVKGNGNVVEQSRNVGEFEKIKVTRGMNVYISQGDEQKIMVKADENLLDVIETKIEGSSLVVTTSKGIRNATSLKVFVTVPDIEEIRSTAGSNVYSENTLRVKALELHASAGSNMKVDIDAKSVDASASAGSNIRLEGKAEFFDGSASSGSNIKAEQLKVRECNAKASSGANIWISVQEKLDGHASSGGNIFYSGDPKSLNTENSSGGNVIKN